MKPSLDALAAQTLPISSLTVVHSCSFSSSILNNARPQFPSVSHVFCTSAAELPSCLATHLANRKPSSYVLALDSATLLEPTAVEKLWLSLVLRPHVPAVHSRAYSSGSLLRANEASSDFEIRSITPSPNRALHPLPLLVNSSSIPASTPSDPIAYFIGLVSHARVLKETLFTSLAEGPEGLSFAGVDKDRLPPFLWSELAFHKWAAQKDEDDVYNDNLYTWKGNEGPDMDLRAVPFPRRSENEPVMVFLVLPWMQMGGSEKCMLDIASYVVKKGWALTFVLTMPSWKEDDIGEIALENQWLHKALALSVDTWDLLSLAPHDMTVRAYRHLLESRRPDYLLMANSRWAYSNSKFVKTIVPKTTTVDYNHMIHMSWEGGGLPRFGANNSQYFDLHLTASQNVADSMKKWINESIMVTNPEKVQTCYVGTNAGMLHTGTARITAREQMRQRYGISDEQLVVLFAGRFVIDKGLDVMADIIEKVEKEPKTNERLVFVFVGSGEEESRLQPYLSTVSHEKQPLVIVAPPAQGLLELRDYYALSDVFLLPSVNEGIALVVYEAMAAGLLVMTTDVGGQKEIVTSETGILLPNFRSLSRMTAHTLDKLRAVTYNRRAYEKIITSGRDMVRQTYTTEKFASCVLGNLQRAHALRQGDKETTLPETPGTKLISISLKDDIILAAQSERYHGSWNMDAAQRSLENSVTIGIKTYICDNSIATQVEALVRSIRIHSPRLRVLLGNDGPKLVGSHPFVHDDPYTEEVELPKRSGISFGRNFMVNLTRTRYFMLLDDDHLLDVTTNLTVLFEGIKNDKYDMVGLRVRNLPGIDEFERSRILIPRYVAKVQSLKERILTLCVWNENNGPSIYGITHPIPVDVLHNAFIGRTDVLRKHPWRNELKVNEHMTFFLDAKDAGVKVGYLPSVFVHHRSRDYSDCYNRIRYREEEYEKLLPYKDQFEWDIDCGDNFPETIKTHIIKHELEV